MGCASSITDSQPPGEERVANTDTLKKQPSRDVYKGRTGCNESIQRVGGDGVCSRDARGWPTNIGGSAVQYDTTGCIYSIGGDRVTAWGADGRPTHVGGSAIQ